MSNTFTDKLLLTQLNGNEIGALIHQDELIQVFLPSELGFEISDIYVGKVKNVVPSIEAAFVEFKNGITGFLSLKKLHYEAVLTPHDDQKLRSGDEILVQIEKEPVKSKDATLTTDIAFSGEYFVIAPFSRGIHYSKKFSENERQQMWDMISDLVPVIFGQLDVFLEKYGLIVRTNAITASKDALLSELHDLFHKTSEVFQISDKRTVFSRIYTDASFYEKTVKNIFKSDSLEIVTDMNAVYMDLTLKGYGPIRLYEDKMLALNKLYGLSQRLEEAISKNVWLKCGGYLVIEPTEAMTVIDVNSGKASGDKTRKLDNPDFVLNVNKEAAREIARQLRLRNLSGMILVDFINLEQKEQNEELLSYFSACLKRDPVETVLVDMTALGLVEVTRKKISAPIHERIKHIL